MFSIRNIATFTVLTVLIFLNNSCVKEENIPPVCVIVSPQNKANCTIGEILEIKVDAKHPEQKKRYKGITHLEIRLLINDQGTASTNVFPYTFQLNTSSYLPGTYKIKVIATDLEGLRGIDEKSIQIVSGLPSVETMDATDINPYFAKVGGIIRSFGGEEILKTGIYWSPLPNPETSGKEFTIEHINQQFSANLSGLLPDQKIYIRAFARNKNGEMLGTEKSFVTPNTGMKPICRIISPEENALFGKGETVPIIVEASDPDGNYLELRLFVNDTGISSTTLFPYRFNWSTITQMPGNYTIRVVAIDNQGLLSSDTRNITIGVRTPLVETADATNIALTTGRVGGKIISNGGSPVSEAGIYWGYGLNPETDGNRISAEIRKDEFTLGISGIPTNSVIYYKAFAVNSIGESVGETKAFKTLGNQTGTFIDSRDNREYRWVYIGSQLWMAENLAWLPSVNQPGTGSNSNKLYYVYDYHGTDVNEAKATEHYKTYGVLYNWAASIDACPMGWHVPSDNEWKELEKALGMSVLDSDNAGWRGTFEGRYLKARNGWYDQGNGSNISDFNALPGGFRLSLGVFDFEGIYANWWTSSGFSSSHSWYRSLYYQNSGVFRNNASRNQGFSVRCLKD